MKLEVGMYVRLENDVEDIVVINKIANVFETTILTENDGSIYQGVYTKENVIKASYNIIDILEVGDAIEVDVIDKDNYPTITGINFARIDNKVELASIKDMLKNESAKLLTVTTHEQMEQMAYKVGE